MVWVGLSLALVFLTAASGNPHSDPAIREASNRVSALETRLAHLEAKARLSELQVGSDRGTLRGGNRIHPELEPVSDSKFYDGHHADYPTDGRPPANVKDHFSFPFPIVQDSHDYDKDYVKDENGDGGEWKAQAYYDKLRMGIGAARAAADRAQEKMVEEKKELDHKIGQEKAAALEADEQQKLADKAAKEAAEAHEDVQEAEKVIDSSEKFVNKEVTDIEECKKQLAEAKAHLDKLLKKHQDRMDAQAKADAIRARNAAADAAAARDGAANARELARLQAECDRLDALVAKAEAALAKSQAELEAAASKLKGHRKADGEHSKGQNGGVYSKSAAHQGAPRTIALFFCGLVGILAIV